VEVIIEGEELGGEGGVKGARGEGYRRVSGSREVRLLLQKASRSV